MLETSLCILSILVLGCLLAVGQKKLRQESHPCTDANHSAMSFWLGEWMVMSEGVVVGSSKIERSAEDPCIFIENYSQADGHAGKSINFYDSLLQQWRQTWADNRGGVSEFAGSLRDGGIHLEGESHTPEGKRILRKMDLKPLPSGEVRQTSQASSDTGKTWAVNYDFVYKHKQ